MTSARSRRGRPSRLAAWATALLLLAAGCGGASSDQPARPLGAAPTGAPAATTAPTPAPTRQPTASEAVRDFKSYRAGGQQPDPVKIRIPRFDVKSGLVDLGLNPDDTIEVPGDFDTAGWWQGGPKPGEPGPAVILGHVDSRSGPAVFFRARELEAGDKIHVDRSDGSTVTFKVDRIEQYPKKSFPTEDVYFPTLEPGLRLVTCGGVFDQSVRSYKDNVIVFASPAGTKG